MTYQKAIEALIAAGFLKNNDRQEAQAVLSSTKTELTYPAWAKALADAGLIRPSDTLAATQVMERASQKEDRDDFDQALEDADIL
jgi:thioredoxin-like negative regulator of GroEL